MFNFCPNKSHPDWKYLVEKSNENKAYEIFIAKGFTIPSAKEIDKLFITNTKSQQVQAISGKTITISPEDIITYNSEVGTIQYIEGKSGSLIQLKDNISLAKDWLEDKLGISGDELELVTGLINNNALGAFKKDGKIVLSNIADNKTVYHEAFHKVFNSYISPEEKKSLFKEVKSRTNYKATYDSYKSVYSELDENWIIEEILAEEFADYIVNGEDFVFSSKENENFFKRLLSFIKKILGLSTDTVKQVYNKINDGYYKGKEVIPEYNTLHNGIVYRKIKLGDIELTAEERKDLFSSLDALFLNRIFRENPYNLFEGKIEVGKIYSDLKIDILRNLSKYGSIERKAILEKAINEYFDKIIEEHSYRLNNKYGIKLNIDLNENEILEPEFYTTENTDENDAQSRDTLAIRASIEFNTKDTMPRAVKMLIGSLITDERNALGLPKQEEWTKIANLLGRNLAGHTDLNSMINVMNSLNNPSLMQLIDTLGGTTEKFLATEPNFIDYTQYWKFKLRNEFVQSFAKTKYNFLLQIIDNGEFKIIDSNNNQISNRVRTEWSNNIKKVANKYKDALPVYLKQLETDDINKLIDLLGLEVSSEIINDTIKYKNGRSQKFPDALRTIRNYVVKYLNEEGKISTIYSDKKTGYSGAIDSLAEAESKYRDVVDLQIINTEGKTVYGISLNTYQSLVIDEINNIINSTNAGEERKSVLKQKLPFLYNVYTKNSIWLKKIENGISPLVNNLMDGSKLVDEDGVHTSQLKESDLTATMVNLYSNGYYFSMKHADRSMYPVYNFLDKEKFASGTNINELVESTIPVFKGYIEDAINKAIQLNSNPVSKVFSYYEKNTKVPGMLEGILNSAEYGKLIEDSASLNDKWVENNIRKYLNTEIDKGIKYAEKWKLYEVYENKTIGLGTTNKISSDLKVAEAIINGLIGNIEQTKLFTGDPSFYKNADDFFKRLNTQSSTGEIMIIGEEQDKFIEANNKKDKFIVGGREVEYSKKINGTITEIVIKDDEFISSVLDEIVTIFKDDLKRTNPGKSEEWYNKNVAEYKNAYSNYVENDGLSLANIFFIKEMSHRSGDYNPQMENVFQQEIKAIGKTTEEIKKLKLYQMPDSYDYNKADKWFKSTYQPFVQEKLQYVGINYGMSKDQYNTMDENKRLNSIAVRKTSYYNLMPTVIVGTYLQQLHEQLLSNGIDVAHFFSAAKVGAKEQRDFYTKSDNSTEGLNLSPININQRGFLDFKYLKKQVKIAPKEKGEIVSSTQSRKNIVEGLIINGIPKDITGNLINTFKDFPEEEKKKVSPVYKLVKEYEDVQTTIIENNITKLLNQLNVIEQEDELLPQIKELANIALQAAKDRNSPDNILDAIENWANTANFIETLPSHQKIQNILNSLITNRILIQKRFGEAMPQSAVTGLEKIGSKRNIVDGKIETSDVLKFYSVERNSNGDIIKVNPAECMIPLPVSWLPKVMKLANTKNVIEAVDWLNEQIEKGNISTAVTIKALRIPNQQLSSNDILKIKKFTYPQYQQSVIVPSELVAKTGGDFDIDKVQMYFKHTNENFEVLDNNNSEATDKILENKLIELEEQLILHPLQARMLFTPVADGELKDKAKELIPSDQRKKTFSQIIELQTNVEAALNFVGGKAGVGQFATWVTFTAIAQLYDLKVVPITYNPEDNTGTQLWFEGLQNNYSLAGNTTLPNTQGIATYTIEALSQLLTSQVDNVKDPYAVALQIVTQTNNVIAYMLLRGVPLGTIVDLLNQPIVKDYLEAQRINESQIIKSTGRKTEYNPQGLELYTTDLIENIKNKYPFSQTQVLLTDKDFKNHNYQRWMLDVFLNLQQQAKEVSSVKNYLSPDTKFLKNKADAKQVVVKLKHAVERSPIMKDVGKILDTGLLKGFGKGRELYYTLFKDRYITEQEGIEEVYDMYSSFVTKFIRGQENKSKAATLFESEFISYLIQRYNPEFNDKFNELFKGNSLPNRLEKLKDKYPDNLFLREVLPLYEGDIHGMKLFRNKMLTDEANELMQSLEELFENEPQLKDELFVYNTYQSGVKNSPYQLNKVFPYDFTKGYLDTLLSLPYVEDIDWGKEMANFYVAFITSFPQYAPNKRQALANETIIPIYKQWSKAKKAFVIKNTDTNKELDIFAGKGYSYVNYNNFNYTVITQPQQSSEVQEQPSQMFKKQIEELKIYVNKTYKDNPTMLSEKLKILLNANPKSTVEMGLLRDQICK